MQNKFLPYIALAVGISALSLSAMFVRWADAPGAVTGFYRLLFSTIFLAPLFVRQQKTLEPIDKRYYIFPLLGGLFTAFDFAFWNSSLKFTTAANATLLGNTSPLWVALFAFFVLRERLRGTFWIGLVIALTGAVLVMGSDFLNHPTLGLGDVMASTAAIFYASYQLITQRGRKYIDPLRYTWLVGVSAVIGMFIMNLVLGNQLTDYPARTWGIFLATAVVSQMIGYLAITYALGHLPASIVSPTLVGQPILTAVLAIPLLGEIPNTTQWVGGAIALVGIYLVNQSHLQAQEELPNA
ncbi:DMT family transporter [Candidatus Villigracilis affinis]|uniref:DMT family transporter n=1 Tax=Candidatus Villigracilis affinis TaxID=3140682 RepID=UPI001DBCC208|nr:DMT family transporter [Anaerolineales bacterium]MBL0344628.1 DMT family transporter [Anaerolineales bacterium]